ncbi:NrfD/PsrC family molybdoenzyme membrane anchor subunit [Methylomagnum ishizawai]|uniref:NrfD/PsrC family molybdoenzyme membrane anchor subunit n=1 Tax=Methylomagnum ishizawai TaxID=1760988 RepID=UPI001C3397B5|nr:NrfD/PsrC family molybdoenzyme membrane anchor subunit [Methylomagnum ishizawai]BBL75807.1 polysulfide reductase NrfD [Methylomagnum ishizawai]
MPSLDRGEPWLAPDQTDTRLSQELGDLATRPTPRGWWWGFGGSSLGALLLFGTALALFVAGVGLWGINTSVVWGFDITNYVWWIGIGNAGTLISAMLYLARQPWRASINRFAEAMTLFAALIAGLFPIMHMGRPYLFYWLAPYPSVMGVWPQFRSPLVWDMFAILIYILVSSLFWYTGLIPDFATLRDRAQGRWQAWVYGVLALGWRGSARHWQRYEQAYTVMAALAVPLVVSVHSVVGYDFSTSVMPGWRSTLFAPFFVVGAMFSGFAMVILITLILRAAFGLYAFITARHLEAMAKIVLAASLLMGYAYAMEVFIPWYTGNPDDGRAVAHNATGPYAPAYWGMWLCNVGVPQVLWWREARRNIAVLAWVAVLVCVGMWLERYVIVVSGLSQGFLPSQFRLYFPTFWDWSAWLGSLGFFLWLFFLFARFVPMVPIHELRRLAHEQKSEAS